MKIEVTGIGLPNKGAELMLCSAVQVVKQRCGKSSNIAIVPNRSSDYGFEVIAREGLRQKLSLIYKGVEFAPFLTPFIPKRLLRAYGFLLESEISVVLDASGLRYSDQFGWGTAFVAYQNYRRLKGRGGKLILLPQAFGPFKCRKTAYFVKRIVEIADLVFVRDAVSFGFLADLCGSQDKIRLARDFTVLYDSSNVAVSPGFEGRVCIIPNGKMLQKTSGAVREQYLGCLSRVIEKIYDAGLQAFVLNHEGVNDDDLCRRVAALRSSALPYTGERSAPEIKCLIGKSSGVLTSRFHGLVSALYQSRPTIATSWSHKYEEVYREFGIKGGVLNPDASGEEFDRIVDTWLEDIRAGRASSLVPTATQLSAQREEVESMWEKVFSVIG